MMMATSRQQRATCVMPGQATAQQCSVSAAESASVDLFVLAAFSRVGGYTASMDEKHINLGCLP
jgi:hypothetical protein